MANVQGNAARDITSLYKALKLNNYSLKLFKDRRVCHKCEGFYHFQALNYKKGIPFLKPYLVHPNIITRSGAIMAYISLTENYMESFKSFKSDLSTIELIKLIDLVHVKKLKIPKNIDRWIRTDFPSMTILRLRIMVFYNYAKKSSEIIALTKHKNDTVKIEALIAIKSLFLIEAKNELVDIFDAVSEPVQIEMLKTLQKIGDTSITSFLENTINKTENKDVKLAAVACLNTVNIGVLNNLAVNNEDVQKMIKHVREIYI
jgi:hypothetical protein